MYTHSSFFCSCFSIMNSSVHVAILACISFVYVYESKQLSNEIHLLL